MSCRASRSVSNQLEEGAGNLARQQAQQLIENRIPGGYVPRAGAQREPDGRVFQERGKLHLVRRLQDLRYGTHLITTLRGNGSERNRHCDGRIPTFSQNGKPTSSAFLPFRLTIRRSTPMCERADVTKAGILSVENFLVQEIKDLLASF